MELRQRQVQVVPQSGEFGRQLVRLVQMLHGRPQVVLFGFSHAQAIQQFRLLRCMFQAFLVRRLCRGDVAAAQATYEEGLKHTAEQPELLYCLGVTEAKQNNLWAAVQHLNKAYELAPELPALRYNLYLALSQLHQLAASQRQQLWTELGNS